MQVVSLSPYLTDLCVSLGLEGCLVGVTHLCNLKLGEAAVSAFTAAKFDLGNDAKSLNDKLADLAIDFQALRISTADFVISMLPSSFGPQTHDELRTLEAQFGLELSEYLGRTVKLRLYCPRRLNDLFDILGKLGADLGAAEKGRELAQRAKAQMMDWCDNFYDRIKSKRVSFISALEPLQLGGYWIPDMIELASAYSQETRRGVAGHEISFEEIRNYRPDVIIVAPQGFDLQSSARTFTTFEALPGWEDLPAVRRGEVFFTDGVTHFFRPTMRLVDSMGILVSAMAGIDSGYMTARDSFYRLRFLELQRHKFTKN